MTNEKMETVSAFCRDVMNLDVSEDRLTHNLTVFADISKEIEILRELDLTEVHPAVVFYLTGSGGENNKA